MPAISNLLGNTQTSTPATSNVKTPILSSLMPSFQYTNTPTTTPAPKAPALSFSFSPTTPNIQNPQPAQTSTPPVTTPQFSMQQIQNQAQYGNINGAPPPAPTPTPTPTPNPIQGVFPSLIQNLAGTQPASSAQNAIDTSNNLATGNNPTGQQSLAQSYINQGAQGLGNIAINQTPAVQAAQQGYNSFAQSSPYMLAAQNNPNVAADIASGRSALLGQTFSQELAAKQAAVQNAIQGEGQQINAAQQEGGLGVSGQQNQINAAQQAGQLANTAQANQIGAQTSALGAVQPQLAGYGQTYYQPSQAGTPQGGASGTNLDPQTYASQLAQQVVSGSLPYAQAQSLMGYAGNAGGAFLQQAIQSANPNFNFGQAEQNSQAQGTIGPQAQSATQAIQALQTAMSQAPGYQTTGVPAINAISGLLATVGLGTGSQAEITDARNEAVTAISNALGSAYNTTPTAFTGLVQSWFPSNPTPSQVQAGITQFNNRIASITQSFASPGTTPLPSAQTGASSGYTTGQTAANGTITWDGSKWVANQ